MTCSARPSSSRVLTPGATAVRTASSASATTRPALRMRRIWSAVLSSIRSLTDASADGRLQGRGQPAGDVVHGPHAVHLHQQPALAIDVDERGGLLEVDLLAPADHLRGVVGPALLDGPLVQPAHDLLDL